MLFRSNVLANDTDVDIGDTKTVLSADGEKTFNGRRAVEHELERLSDHVLYVPKRLSDLRHTTGASSWVCHT